jgi:hypothetical protein
MDHLPRLLGSIGALPDVPFYCRYEYAEGGILEFPGRRDFKVTNPGGIYARDEYSAFFQAWLYFGTLIEVFRTYDIRVSISDFSRRERGRQLLTTDCLRDYIAAWIVRASRKDRAILEKDMYRYQARTVGEDVGATIGRAVGKAIVRGRYGNIRSGSSQNEPCPKAMTDVEEQKEGREDTKARAFKIYEVLRTVSAVMHDYGSEASYIDDAVWDSVLILGCTLQTAAYFIYRAFQFDFKFLRLFDNLSARLRDQMYDENGWCPREKKIIGDLVEGDQCVLYLCAHLDRREDRYLHSRCDQTRCEGYQIKDNAEYKTKHVKRLCECGFVGFGSSKESFICKAVYQKSNLPRKLGSAPMITYKDGELQIVHVSLIGAEAGRLTKIPYTQQYVAISHVWADGLGNRDANDLPICQVSRLQVSSTSGPAHLPRWLSSHLLEHLWELSTSSLDYGSPYPRRLLRLASFLIRFFNAKKFVPAKFYPEVC